MKRNYWTYHINMDPTNGCVLPCVTIEPVWHWMTEKCCADSYSDAEWNDLIPTIDKLGLCELMESTFEADGYQNDRESLEEDLLKEGFVKDETFEKFMEEYN